MVFITGATRQLDCPAGRDQHQHALAPESRCRAAGMMACSPRCAHGRWPWPCPSWPCRVRPTRCAHVLEVHVHLAVPLMRSGDAAHGVLEHVVGVSGALVLVMSSPSTSIASREHHDQRIDNSARLQSSSAFFMRRRLQLSGLVTTPTVRMPISWPRSSASMAQAARAAHAGRDEQHVRAPAMAWRMSSCAASAGLRPFVGFLVAGAQAVAAQLDGAVRRAARERLSRCSRRRIHRPCTLRAIMCATALAAAPADNRSP